VLLVTALNAWNGAATLSVRHGQQIEGEIRGGSPHHIVIEGRDERLYAVRRDSVKDIDHPGNVAVVGGGLGLAFGVGSLADQHCERGDCPALAPIASGRDSCCTAS
jgi:hypothetical protein